VSRIRVVQGTERNRAVREVVDGQQRINALLWYIDGSYPLSRTLFDAAPVLGMDVTLLAARRY